MNIPKAIEILTHLQIPLRTAKDHDRFDSIKLGNEALKRIEHGRLLDNLHCIKTLPGETKD